MSERRIKLSQVPQAELESWPMPLERAQRWVSAHEDGVAGQVVIFLTQHAYLACAAHAASEMTHEVGGVLVGQVRREEQDGRVYIVIEDTIQAQHTEFGPAHLTFTQDSLVQLNNELDERFPGKRMVGWYHTHPRLDVFLSTYDVWIHSHFFGKPWQVALVIEPWTDRGGFFCWQEGRELDPHRYVGFYELADVCDETVVSWANLAAAGGKPDYYEMERGDRP